jgi:hypothetical protein
MTQSGYENAPATRMLATECAVCSRPLVDAVSVETGIGPECRRKHGYTVDVSEEARAEGNVIVHAIAAGLHTDAADFVLALARLRVLGFETLADTITRRQGGGIEIATDADPRGGVLLTVKTPYNASATDAWRRVPGRRWNGERKVNTAPYSSKAAVWDLLRQYHHGAIGLGPTGPFVVR